MSKGYVEFGGFDPRHPIAWEERFDKKLWPVS